MDSNGAQGRRLRDSLHAVVDAKLKAVADASAMPPPWYKPWLELGPESTEEARLAVYQSVRRAGSLPDAASFFLVSHLIDEIASRDGDDALGEYEFRLREIEQAYRLEEGGVWPSGLAPAGYTELREQYYRAWNELFAQKLEELGETEMAQLFGHDHDRFEQLSEEGSRYFRRADVLDEAAPFLWLRALVEAVADCMTADGPSGPLGYRYGEEDGYWQVDVYPTPVELVGGAVDGEIVAVGYQLDVEHLRTMFDRIDFVGWHSLGFPADEGPRMVFEGCFQRREVVLQVLAQGPDDEEPGMRLDTVRRPT